MTTAHVVETTVPVNNNPTNWVLDMYLQEPLRGQEKPLQKTAKRQGKIEETWVGTRQAQKLKLNFFYLFIYLIYYLS